MARSIRRTAAPARAETLEERQMLTLVVDVRAADGSKTVTATSVGQVIDLQVWAEITDPQNDPAADAFQAVFSSFLGTGVGPATPIDGNLSATLESQFTANGSSNGIAQDLNGDGNLDVGSNTPTSATGFLYARSGSALGSTATGATIGTVGSQSALEFEIATLTYTVTSMAGGGETQINSRPRSIEPGSDAGTWFEDSVAVDPATEPPVAGTPVDVVAAAPVASPIQTTAAAGIATSINVIGSVQSLPGVNPASVQIENAPAGATVVASADGTISFTPAVTAYGIETFQYLVEDTNGVASNLATVTVNVTPANSTPPVVGNSTSLALAGAADAIDISGAITAALPLGAYTANIASPSGGTAVASSPFNGTITYTPAADFVGVDSISYTLTAPGGQASNVGAVSVEVGIALSTARGGVRTAVVKNGRATVASATLAGAGVADVYFTGRNTLSERAGTATVMPAVASAAAPVNQIALSGTTLGGTLSLGGDISLASITDAAPLGRLVAPASTLAGTLNVGGLSLLQVAAMSGATITVGSADTAAGMSVRSGPITGSTIASSAALTLSAGALATDSITAPAVRSVHASSIAASQLTVSTAGGRASVVSTGAISSFSINAAGNVLSLSAPSIMSSSIAASSIPTLAVRGGVADMTLAVSGVLGTLSAASVADSTLAIGSAGNLRIGGPFSGTTLDTVGNLANLSAGEMTADTIDVGATATPLAAATAASLGSATLGSVRITSRAAGAFADTTILAHTITAAALGNVDTDNGGVADGLAAALARSISFTADGAVHRLAGKTVASGTFGDFQIAILG